MSAPTTPPLGWIPFRDRTQSQTDAHDEARKHRVKFALPPVSTAGVKVMLTDFWKHPLCVADMGQEFTGFHQLTGSCVGASEGDAVCTLSCVQRLLSQGATKAFIPWWPFPYGRTRYNEGDRGQGEGAVDSVMGRTLQTEGIFDINQPGLPKFSTDDGMYLTSRLELQWSDGASIAQSWRDLAKHYPVQGIASLGSVEDIKTAIINGYPVLDGCDYYIGNGSVQGSGDNAAVVGNYDGRGGHSTCYLGYWDNPTLGPLYLYSNQWPTSTYPRDPAGAGRCCVWVKESNVQTLFRNGGSDGETMALSHLTYFPAQPELLNWLI